MRSLPRFLAASTLFLALAAAVHSAEPGTPPVSQIGKGPVTVPASTPAAELRVRDSIVLGLIEGITEFLPISSTGHLIVATRALGLDSEVQLIGPGGDLLWHRRPSVANPNGVPLTPKLAADTYNVVIQFGAIAAVVFLYWRALVSMAMGLLGSDPAGRRLLIHIAIAFTPAAVLGLLLHDWIDAHLFSVPTVIATQVLGAGLMLYAESWRKRQGPPKPELGNASALQIGLLQCVALVPGTSRSMMTIVGGYFAGLEPKRAAEFSFLLGFVTLTAAAAYKSLKSGPAMIAVFGWPHVLLGAAVAAISAALAVRFLVTYLSRHGLAAFAVYRLVTAAALAVWMMV